MKLLQGAILCLLLSSLCSGVDDAEVKDTATPVLSSTSATKTSVPTSNTTSSPNVAEKSTVEISTKGTTSKEPLETSLLSTLSSVTTAVNGEGSTVKGVTKTEFITPRATVINLPLPNAISTLQSSQSKTEIQSSIKATETPVNTPQPDASPSRIPTLSSISVTILENISQSQGTENAKNASSSSTSPSYSSIILPVVIALIAITLSVFALVGLYRMCWKTDPGTPENGNDQPQSDKESVKLLTVKTISHESGERSAQGKTKN
ncbi:endomucin [Physeter macrocephalus]|uniref:Endomucin n=1 Tax=Physeter macrocephalus TaxID=9755 RepID=A0A455BHV9_PHYMC|nr:endomucin [Physeter catodon]XP_028347489.1 endomucin [Physeter catodon]|eukprot:XP_028347488.1 endomucin [Physeter catodon]